MPTSIIQITNADFIVNILFCAVDAVKIMAFAMHGTGNYFFDGSGCRRKR
jgi:hypothetical protein